ncbi:aspartate kinase [Vibrio penaeicida]|uniref:Aspartokinase n=1 Tax=Vibrio penaeicida TaxID=104609 RepID=A0AAV5NTQ4_9VIBR|nr:aspartate kinase [Vibrio penaeicida]RTZ23187.1 aspartate kinase [Vibrio penaeicida]GLQ73805.1 aspartokinase [Vibrio penaeicida]
MTQSLRESLVVQKFGGTSVGSIERIEAVAERIIKTKQEGKQLVVVVSAMSGETNRLLGLAQQIDSVPTARELDVLLSAGEQVSMALLAMTLNKKGVNAVSLTGSQAGIKTNGFHNDASIESIDTNTIQSYLENDHVVIVAGFQGVSESGNITTLGRGGSDTTAVALAGALNAVECQIFTDVDGIYTCDPRIVKSARKLTEIDFPSMEEMARKGAKVLHLPSVIHAWKHGIPLRVLSSFSENSGTLVTGEQSDSPICGLAIQRDLIVVEVKSSALQSIRDQSQMLGIDVWATAEDVKVSDIVIPQSSLAKLSLIASESIEKTTRVSAISCVGCRIQEVHAALTDEFAQHQIPLLGEVKSNRSCTYFIEPERIEEISNHLHNFIVAGHLELDGHQKLMVS